MFLSRRGKTVQSFIGRKHTKPQTQHGHYNSSKPVDVVVHCMNSVKEVDHESFFWTLALPSRKFRASGSILHAFNIELWKLQNLLVDDIRQQKFQFWRDVVEGGAGNTPVSFGLQQIIEKHNLTKQTLLRLIKGKEERLNLSPFTSLEEVEDYSEKTHGSLNYLLLECLGFHDSMAENAASHLGKCQGITTLLRGVPNIAKSHKAVLLPSDLMKKHGVSQEEILSCSKEQKVKDLVSAIAGEAKAHLEKARSFKDQIPNAAKPALLYSVCADRYFKSLRKADFDVFHPKLRKTDGLFVAELMWKRLKRTY